MLGQAATARDSATLRLPFAISTVAGSLVLAAPAKINLFLEILGKRPDGYHSVETLILAVNLFDTLEFQAQPRPGPLMLNCQPATIPAGPGNLVWRAAEALRQAANVDFTATIRLQKRIPHEAGLGGGSSDAAMTLLGLNQLWQLDRPVEELREIAATIGSDVGAFLTPPGGWCTGRGELVEPLTPAVTLNLVLVKPPFGLSTAAVYRGVQVPANPISGLAAQKALKLGDLAGIATALHNRLQEPAFAAQPMVREIYQRLIDCKPLGVLLSGSGSCVFALCSDSPSAHRVATRFRQQDPIGCSVFVVQSVRPMASFIH